MIEATGGRGRRKEGLWGLPCLPADVLVSSVILGVTLQNRRRLGKGPRQSTAATTVVSITYSTYVCGRGVNFAVVHVHVCTCMYETQFIKLLINCYNSHHLHRLRGQLVCPVCLLLSIHRSYGSAFAPRTLPSITSICHRPCDYVITMSKCSCRCIHPTFAIHAWTTSLVGHRICLYMCPARVRSI